MNKRRNFIARAFWFYIDGFRNLTWWGKKLWLIIIIKAVIMFGILKIFFFNDYLNTNFETDTERSNHVLDELTGKNR
jgi:hypothetical protein